MDDNTRDTTIVTISLIVLLFLCAMFSQCEQKRLQINAELEKAKIQHNYR